MTMAIMIEFIAGMLVGVGINLAMIILLSGEEPEPKPIHTPAPGETILPGGHPLTEEDKEILREMGLKW